ncbi:unnamed protein product [Protopolystoma xenopodis]|uniref:Alpha-helical coiled-coil rod protein n=1 Tax=Protopolystoma xenopodis TaxID=117903 RepID=A0A3S5BKG0_9PLAT|nr:unnamed protein product [Protopolystoma xenopodis]
MELAKIQVSSLEAVLKIQEQQLCRSVSTEMAATSKVTSLTKAEDLFVRRSLPFITQYNSTKSPSSTLTGLLTAWRNQVLRLLVQREVAALAAHQHQANERLLRESVEIAKLTDNADYDAGEAFGNVPRPRFNFENDHADNELRTKCVPLSLPTNITKFAESRVAQLTTQLSTMRDDMRCLKSACNSLYKETFMGLDTLMRQLGLAGLMQKPSMESSDRRNTNQNAIKPDLKQSQDRARVHLRMAHPTHAETECQSESETDNLPNPGSTPSVVSNLLSLSRLGHISYSQQTPFMSLVLHRLRELDRRLAFACQRLPMLSIQMARYRRNSAMAAISANGDFISRSSRACQTVESSSPNIMESLYGWHSETDNVVSGLGPLAFEELKSIARQAELEAAKAAREREIAIRQLEVDTKTFNERVDAVRASGESR